MVVTMMRMRNDRNEGRRSDCLLNQDLFLAEAENGIRILFHAFSLRAKIALTRIHYTCLTSFLQFEKI